MKVNVYIVRDWDKSILGVFGNLADAATCADKAKEYTSGASIIMREIEASEVKEA